jgi:hypothetical protein
MPTSVVRIDEITVYDGQQHDVLHGGESEKKRLPFSPFIFWKGEAWEWVLFCLSVTSVALKILLLKLPSPLCIPKLQILIAASNPMPETHCARLV